MDDTKPKILRPGYYNTIDQFAKELGEYYSNKTELFYDETLQQVVRLRLTQFTERITRQNIKVYDLIIENKYNFVTFIEKDFIVGTYVKDKKTGESIFVKNSITVDMASAILKNNQFKKRLPIIRYHELYISQKRR